MCWSWFVLLDLSVYAGDVHSSCKTFDVNLLTPYSIYQEYLAKSLTDKYGNLSVQMDKIINDANSEIDGLNQKLGSKQPV